MGAKRDLKTMLFRLVLVTCYCLLGAAIFYAIEYNSAYDDEVMRKETLYNKTRADIMQRFGINETEFELLVSKVRDAKSHTPLQWSFARGIDLAWQAMTTIGYGNKTPTTLSGQLFFIPYALLGIPLTAFFLKTVGENISHFINFVINKIEKGLLKRSDIRKLELKSLIVTIGASAGLTLFMAAVSTRADEWSFGQGLYVWFVTFTTVGFGDLIPGEDADAKGGIGVVLYRVILVIIGLSLIATVLNSVVDFAEKRNTSAFQLCDSCCAIRRWSKQDLGKVHELNMEQKRDMKDESTQNGTNKEEKESREDTASV